MRNELTYTSLLSKPIKVASEGRKCQIEGCTTTLSIYNFGKYCHAHIAKGVELDDISKYNRARFQRARQYQEAHIRHQESL